MKKISIDAGGNAYAASAMNHVVTTDLEVFERAVTLRSAKGEVCPQAGWTISRPWTPTDQGRSVRAGFGNQSLAMKNVRTFKARSGSHAISSSG